MATTVVKTIGTGGDYSTVQAWEDACPADLVAADQIWQGQLKNQEFVASNVLTVSGQNTDSTRYVELTTEAGASFADHANKAINPLRYDAAVGAALKGTGAWGTSINITTGYTRLTKLQIYGAGVNSIAVRNNGGTIVGTIDRCIVEQAQNGEALYSDGVMNVINSVIIAKAAHHGVMSAFGGTIYGCTFIGSGGGSSGIRNSYGTFTVKNTYVGGFGATTGAGGTKSVSNSYTSESGPPSGWSGTVALSTSTFENVTFTTHDFRLKSGSGLINVGTDEASYTTDIIGTARSSGSYDVGAWEFASSGATITGNLGTATAAGFAASIVGAVTIACALGGATASGYQASISTGSNVTITASIGAATASGYSASVVSSGSATITTDVFKNNTGTVLASTSIPKAVAIKLSDLTLAASWTSQTTNGSGVLSLTSAGMTTSTDYLLVVSNADGSAVGVKKYTAV